MGSESKLNFKIENKCRAPRRSAAVALPPGSAIRLVAGPPLVAFGEGSAGKMQMT
jgi:hypothetical protein